MKIYLASNQSLMINRGGPSYKLIQLHSELSRLGIDVQFFDMWNADNKYEKDELFHIFTAGIGVYHLAENIIQNGAKFVVNPIVYNRNSYKKVRAYSTFQRIVEKMLSGTHSDFGITRKICNSAEIVLPNTIEEEKYLKNGLGVKNKFKVIHNGVEKRFLYGNSSIFTKKYGINDFLLYVGHLGQKRKNSERIIKAFSKINHPCVIIANVMNNNSGKKCIKMIKKSKNILFLNWVKHDDPLLASAYAACHTFVLPTLYETPGRAALEASLAGANVVITPFGGTKEYFADLADYVNPYSVKAIAHSLENSLNKTKNEKLKQHIQANFLWKNIAEETLKMYKQIL
ncbi:MAG: glycosyltransferase [Candidatus Cloacimonetes bacterium]|nr:glycosyltransferase [Candidatus Cloacimonadota bacterium]